MKRQITLTLLPIGLVIFCLTFGHITIAAPGDLDPTFRDGGKFTDWQGYARAVAIQSDGKIEAAGQSTYNGSFSSFALTRYNADGSLDASFGSSGRVLTGFGGESWANSVAIQADGKIVAAGVGLIGTNNFHFALARYNPDGSLDASFDGDGKVTTVVGTSVWDDEIRSVAIQPDGRIVAVGLKYIDEGDTSIALARYNTNGSLDTSFDVDGIAITPIGPSYDLANSAAIQVDGKIVAAGYSHNGSDGDFALVRYNTNGSVDTTFGGNGVVITPLRTSDDIANSAAIQVDGKIVAAGYSHNGSDGDFALVRYNTNGLVDTTFGGNGVVTTPIGMSEDYATDVVVQSDGKILASGSSYNGSNNDFALARYLPNGSLDATFGGGDGKTTVDFNNSDDNASGMTLDGQGRAVVIGGLVGSFPGGFAIARFLLDGGPSPTPTPTPSKAPFDFDGDGKTDISVYRPADGNWYVLNSGASPSYSVTNWGNSTDIPAPAEFDGDGKTDVAVYRPSTGQWFIVNSKDSSYTIANWGTAGDKPVPRDFDGNGKADISVYRPSNGTWYIFRSNGSGWDIVQWGGDNDVPVPGRYDPDDKTDIAVYRPSTGQWFVLPSTGGGYAANWGTSGDKPVPADYDGDDKNDIAVYRPSDGNWYIYRSNGTGYDVINWGINTDTPVPGDYDGDTKADIAQYRPSTGQWFILKSTGGYVVTNWGTAGDKPSPASYIPQAAN